MPAIKKYHTEEERAEAKREYARKYRNANPEKARLASKLSRAKFHEDPSRLATALLRGVMTSLARKTRVLNCDLTVGYIQRLLDKQNYRDAYYPQLELGLKGQGKNPFSASVDRKDPSKGYVKGNVHIVCWSTNLQKGELTHKQMLNLVEKIYGVA